ncbi:MAG: hypothetical protein ISR69_11400 [Gammaproteobacteria bacterium]|nr:hypothetical protein [Gammaproteobacteria bacterium]
MGHDIIIWGAIAVTAVVLVGVHFWLHKLVIFKMDESTIVKHIKKSSPHDFIAFKELLVGSEISEERVQLICHKSKQIETLEKEDNSLFVKLLKA